MSGNNELNSLLHIGANRASMEAAAEAIVTILLQDQDQVTLQKALETLGHLGTVSNVDVSHSNFKNQEIN